MSETPTRLLTVFTADELALLAQVRASFGSFLNVHFLNLPNERFVGQLRGPEFAQALESLCADESLPADTTQGAILMQQYLQETQELSSAELAQALGVDRTRLYRGVSPSYGPPPPYEAVWSPGEVKITDLLQEVAAIYRQSGLAPAAGSSERLDYIGIELAYLIQLAQDEAAAWESGEAERANQLFAGQNTFLLEHLARWVPLFIQKALQYAQTGFYRGHLLMLRGFLADQQAILSEQTL